LPTGIGRIAVIAFYALSGSVSFLWAMQFLAWCVGGKEQSVEGQDSEAPPVKQKLSMAVFGVLLTYQGIRLVMAAWMIWRA